MKLTKIGAVKLDQGYKSVLRPFRKALQNLFEKEADLFKGRHHWDESKWFLRVRIFLEDRHNIRGFSDTEVAAVILMLYPAFGPSSGTEDPSQNKTIKKQVDRNSKVFKLLRDEGMELFKTMITDNNNDQQRKAFFTHKVIQRLWSVVSPVITRDLCFTAKAGPNKQILPTYAYIANEMHSRF